MSSGEPDEPPRRSSGVDDELADAVLGTVAQGVESPLVGGDERRPLVGRQCRLARCGGARFAVVRGHGRDDTESVLVTVRRTGRRESSPDSAQPDRRLVIGSRRVGAVVGHGGRGDECAQPADGDRDRAVHHPVVDLGVVVEHRIPARCGDRVRSRRVARYRRPRSASAGSPDDDRSGDHEAKQHPRRERLVPPLGHVVGQSARWRVADALVAASCRGPESSWAQIAELLRTGYGRFMRSRWLAVLPLALFGLAWRPHAVEARNDYGGPDENPDRATPQAAPPDDRPLTTFAATAAAATDATNAESCRRRSDRRLSIRRTGPRGHGERGLRRASADRLRAGRSTRSSAASGVRPGRCTPAASAGTRPTIPLQRPASANPVTYAELLQHLLEQPRPGPGDRRHGRQGRWRLQHDTAGSTSSTGCSPATPRATSTPTPASSASSRSCSTTAAGTATATAASRWNDDARSAASVTTTMSTSTSRSTAPTATSRTGARAGLRAEDGHPGVLDFNAGWRQAVSWWNLVPDRRGGPAVPARLRPSDRRRLERRRRPGRDHRLGPDTARCSCRPGRRRLAATHAGIAGRSATTRSSPATGTATGSRRHVSGTVTPATSSSSRGPTTHRRSATPARGRRGYDKVIAGDMDGDGRVDDLFIWDIDAGRGSSRASPTSGRRTATTAVVEQATTSSSSATGAPAATWTRCSSGTATAGPAIDQLGRHLSPSIGPWRPTESRHEIRGGDYDTDGRADDLFLYYIASGRWYVWSYHRNVPTGRASGRWLGGYDVISVGSFMD